MGELIKKEDLPRILTQLRNIGKTIVTTNGCFDILHVGHVRYLQKTKTFADTMIVCLNSDSSVRSIKGPTRPINNENDRAEILCALSCVDYVVLFEEKSPAKLLENIKPNVYTKGADYTLETLPERDIIIANNIRSGEIVFNTYIPVVAWGKEAEYVAKLNIGDYINIDGHFSSRVYKKPNGNDFELKMAYEISVDRIWEGDN